MKAIAVFPGKPHSVHLADLPKPALEDIPEGRGVLVKVLRVGVDGTDREINAAAYGAAAGPAGRSGAVAMATERSRRHLRRTAPPQP